MKGSERGRESECVSVGEKERECENSLSEGKRESEWVRERERREGMRVWEF